MGNPDGDLFIKTISWLFVVPASHRGATGGLYSPPQPPSPLPDARQRSDLRCFLSIFSRLCFFIPHTLLIMFAGERSSPSMYFICTVHHPPNPSPAPTPALPLSWVHPRAVTLNLNI